MVGRDGRRRNACSGATLTVILLGQDQPVAVRHTLVLRDLIPSDHAISSV